MTSKLESKDKLYTTNLEPRSIHSNLSLLLENIDNPEIFNLHLEDPKDIIFNMIKTDNINLFIQLHKHVQYRKYPTNNKFIIKNIFKLEDNVFPTNILIYLLLEFDYGSIEIEQDYLIDLNDYLIKCLTKYNYKFDNSVKSTIKSILMESDSYIDDEELYPKIDGSEDEWYKQLIKYNEIKDTVRNYYKSLFIKFKQPNEYYEKWKQELLDLIPNFIPYESHCNLVDDVRKSFDEYPN